jgi:uracil-DNA glycosylase family 4
MGFWDIEEQSSQGPSELKGFSADFLNRNECKVCPLNNRKGCVTPHMKPAGNKEPLIYMLGPAPRHIDDKRSEHFAGAGGRIIRRNIPKGCEKDIRWNYCARTAPPDDRDPTLVEIECCRPSVVKDIEQTKPDAIFGFGATPLDWALGEIEIHKWSGRRVPVKIGNHTCWFFPFVDPQVIIESEPKQQPEKEFGLAVHLRDAFAAIKKGLPEPRVLKPDEVFEGVSIVTGENGDADVRRVLDWFDHIAQKKYAGFDYETKGKRPYNDSAYILTAALADDTKSLAWAMHHPGAKWTTKQIDKIEDAFIEFLDEAPTHKVAHALAFEQEWTAWHYGRQTILNERWEDTMAQAYVLDERPWSNSLDFLVLQYFGLRIKGFSDVDKKNLDKEPLPKVLRYNGGDAKWHLNLFYAQRERLEAQDRVYVYEDVVTRVTTQVLTQLRGVPVDQDINEDFLEQYKKKLKGIEDEIFDLDVVRRFEKTFNADFRPSANDDVKKLLHKILKLDVDSTDEKVLKEIKHPIAKLITKHRSASKMISTYIESVGEGSEHLYDDGLLHPIISALKTRTSRTSSEEPNIQNWTKHKEGKELRQQVTAKAYAKANPRSYSPVRYGLTDPVIVAIDFAGIQARNVAMESGDKKLIASYFDHYDIHSDWRERILRRVPSWIPKAERNDKDRLKHFRQESKNKFVFPTFFGAQPFTIVRGLGIEERDAADLIEEFFDEFPDIRRWHEKVFDDYNELGYVTGLTGFQRHAPIRPNQMINSPIQADETLIVTTAQWHLARYEDPKFTANWMIHDDLAFIWSRKEVEKNTEIAVKEMVKKRFDWINVPLGVEVSLGEDWFTMKGIGDYENTPDGGVVEVKK